MTHSKQSTTLFAIMLLLLAFLPALLLAQTDGETTSTDNDTTVSTETETEVNDNTTTNTPIARPGTRPNPTTVRPIERKTDSIMPFQGNARASTSVNSIPRPNVQDGNVLETRQAHLAERPSLEERQAQMEAKRLEFQTNQTERRAALAEKAQERISNFAATLSDRMFAAIERIEQVIVKIESRMEKIKEQGIDTSEAERYLTSAKEDLRNASAILSDIDTGVVVAVTSDDPKSAWAEVRTAYQNARDAIRSAHANIKQAVASLKNSIKDDKKDEADADNSVNEDTE